VKTYDSGLIRADGRMDFAQLGWNVHHCLLSS
jgi:hypothetical protein